MTNHHMDVEERDILDRFEKGELRPAPDADREMEDAREAAMYTFGQYVADEKKESEVRTKKELLLAFIRKVWGNAEAERVAPFPNAAELVDLPDIANLVDDHAAGRSPRLGANGRTEPRA